MKQPAGRYSSEQMEEYLGYRAPARPVRFCSVDLRDGQQSQIATRMTTQDVVSVLGKMDALGFDSIEMWGGATFDAALRFLGDEVPYGIGVAVNKFEEREDGLVEIDCDVICEKQAHKSIVIGKGGEKIKKISTEARRDIERMIDAKVFLNLYVRVKPDWRDSGTVLGDLGYDKKNI